MSAIQHPSATIEDARNVLRSLVATIVSRTIRQQTEVAELRGDIKQLETLNATNLQEVRDNHLANIATIATAYTAQVERLEGRLREDAQRRVPGEDPATGAPDGFQENAGRIPHFNISFPDTDLDIQARFVRLSPRDYTQVEGTMGGEGDPVYLRPLYAQPQLYGEENIEPFPEWFVDLAASNRYHIMLEHLDRLDDWGLTADVARYRAITHRLQDLQAARIGIDDSIHSALDDLDRTRYRLEAARAPRRLRHLSHAADPDGRPGRRVSSTRRMPPLRVRTRHHHTAA